MTLSEFARKCRGSHRRQIEQWHHTRLLAASMYNANRAPDSEPILPQDLLPLPGDEAGQAGNELAEMTEEEYWAIQARIEALDQDLLS